MFHSFDIFSYNSQLLGASGCETPFIRPVILQTPLHGTKLARSTPYVHSNLYPTREVVGFDSRNLFRPSNRFQDISQLINNCRRKLFSTHWEANDKGGFLDIIWPTHHGKLCWNVRSVADMISLSEYWNSWRQLFGGAIYTTGSQGRRIPTTKCNNKNDSG